VRYTAAPQRRDELLRLVDEQGYISSRQVAATMDVSDMTIRRDLDQLAGDGLVLRVIGGARRPSGSPFAERAMVSVPAKDEIAAACAALFADGLLSAGMVVGLDAGTTVERIVRQLPAGVTVVTHSVPVMSACAARADLTLIGLGGSFEPRTKSFGGPETRAQLANIHLDLAIVSASALRATGLYCADASEADTKRAALAAADRSLVVADHTKLHSTAPIRVSSWPGVDLLLTDAGADAAARKNIASWPVTAQVGMS
jgi:DeoR family fructose operon transcriptional repressor